MNKERSQVAKEDTWNVEALYPNLESWEKDYKSISNENQKPHWPFLSEYKGRLGENPEATKKTLNTYFELDRKLTSLLTYSRLRQDEELTNDSHKKACAKMTSIMLDFHQETSWIEPELLSLPQHTINAFLNSPELTEYHFYLEKILRLKPHTLSEEQESLIAVASKAFQTSYRAFSSINDADFNFGFVLDGKGEKRELTHGLYGLYIREHDRELRKNAFITLHKKYMNYENTLCELLNGQVQTHLFNATARKYNTCLDAALYPKNIDPAVYHSLIQAVHENIGYLHEYVEMRKTLPGIDQLHLYDMYVPLSSEVDIRMTYQEAEDLVIQSVAPLGSEYQNVLRKGFKEDRWVDRYENKHKRSGAYSSGCYDSMPYILMNYKNLLRDVFTLTHEAGHSMHSYLSHKHQPYQYGDYPIFLAEVASIFNEELLSRVLLKQSQSKQEKIFLLTQKIEDIRTTLFRQTMFAEFELLIHTMAEKNVPLTPKSLKDEFKKLNTFYFGKNVIIDEEAEIEWARIPHFYYNFYVFQYATGISAALALAEKVLSGGKEERNAYLSFLKGGSSKYPIDMLIMAGVDMRSPKPIHLVMNRFKELLTDLKNLLNN